MMHYIQGMGVFYRRSKRTKAGKLKLLDPVDVAVEAISEDGYCTVIFPNGSKRRLLFTSIKRFQPIP